MNPVTEVKTNPNVATESFARKFKKIYLGDDLDGFMQLVNKDAVWTFMATGETYRGIEQIRKAAKKAMAGRVHTKDLHMELTNLFSGEEQYASSTFITS
jgi:ketosteroid isomerase-like protein